MGGPRSPITDALEQAESAVREAEEACGKLEAIYRKNFGCGWQRSRARAVLDRWNHRPGEEAAYQRGVEEAAIRLPSWYRPGPRLQSALESYEGVRADLAEFDGDKRGIAAALDEQADTVFSIIAREQEHCSAAHGVIVAQVVEMLAAAIRARGDAGEASGPAAIVLEERAATTSAEEDLKIFQSAADLIHAQRAAIKGLVEGLWLLVAELDWSENQDTYDKALGNARALLAKHGAGK